MQKNYIKTYWTKCYFKEICYWIPRRIRRLTGEEAIFKEKIMEDFTPKLSEVFKQQIQVVMKSKDRIQSEIHIYQAG